MVFYVVDQQWINQWTAFIKDEGSLPREMDNTNIRNYIIKWRNSNSAEATDDSRMQMKKGEDYCELSAAMWKFLYDNYGCRPVIAVRYFLQSPEGILPSIYRDLVVNLNKQQDIMIH